MTLRDYASVVARDPLAWIVLAVTVVWAVLHLPEPLPTTVLGTLGSVAFFTTFYGFSWLLVYAVCFHGRTRWRDARRRGAAGRDAVMSALAFWR